MSWREPLLRVLRVPPTPAPPPGSPPRVFRAARNYFVLRMIRWSVAQLFAIAGLVGAIVFIRSRWFEEIPEPGASFFLAGEVIGVLALSFQLLFGWMIVRLDFELRWYLLSDRAIRIREGITTVREKTIALANIQNIAVRQGPLQRLLGIADVEVKTAGGGGGSSEPGAKGGGESMHVAYFRGVDNAEEIRDLLRVGVRLQRNTGLGDPDEPEREESVTAAAAELLTEARKLRAAVAVPPRT